MLLCFFVTGAIAYGQPNEAQEKEIEKAWDEAQKVKVDGPAEITLIDQAKIKLPQGYIYIPQPQAGALMQSIGNSNNPTLVGLILPKKDNRLLITISFEKSGYIKDDDAKNWNVDELFTSIKEGTEESNKERKAKGFPELEVVGWVEKPKYDETRHHLVWSMSARRKGDDGSNPDRQSVNYKTYALGREGYLTLNLITNFRDVETFKPVAAQLLGGTEYNSGKRYEEFNSSTDKVAEYGLAALIAGAAAKKLGFFGLIAAFVVKFAKVIGVAALGLIAALSKIFGKKKDETPPTGPTGG